jgi:probable HAF family extracellular repeat protein
MEEHMKRMLTTIAAGSLLATLALAQPPRYKLTDLGPVGLPPGEPYFIANTGLVAGAAPMPDGTMHAVLWYGGHKLDIGANRLGGPNSQAFSVNDRGQVVGEAQTSVPNSEDFCGFNAMGLPSSATACRPFVWQNGMIAELPNTLGGANAVANLINNRGAVAGLAETNQHEPGCPVGQFSPVIWQNGKLQSLPTYAGDPDGGVFGINDKGQSVGASGSCAPFNPNSQLYLFESHALLWDSDGSVHDLGNFGGTGAFAGNHGCAINNQGQVVGHSDVTGDTTTYGFLWTAKTGMQPLYPLSRDFASLANSINDSGEVVGASFDANFVFRAVLWQNGKPTDLNSLLPAGSPLYLQLAASVNSSGEIIGFGQTSKGEIHGFLATPNNDENARESVLPSAESVTPAVPSESSRKLLFQRLGIRAR